MPLDHASAFLVTVSPERGDWEYARDPRDPHRFMPRGAHGGWTARALWRPIEQGSLVLFKFTSPRMDEPVGTYCAADVVTPPDPEDPDHRFMYRANDALTAKLRTHPLWPDETTSLFGRSYGHGVLQLKAGKEGELRRMLDTRATATKGALPPSAVEARKRSASSRLARGAKFTKAVLRHANGRCCACADGIDYRTTKILQAAHIRGVEDNGIDDLSNGLALCPTHHALFDRFFWTTDGKRIEVAPAIPVAIRRGLRRQLACPWLLDPRQLRWHQIRFQRSRMRGQQ